jgi:hypothetical protein
MTRPRRRRWIVAAVFIAASGTAGASARADAPPVALAEALFRDGARLFAGGQIDKACSKFAESQKLDPALGTIFFLAVCHEKQGLTASAWSEFTAATEWAEREDQPERAMLGRKHLSALAHKLATVQISATRVSGLELRVDDGPLSSAAMGTPLPLDPGEHLLEARAPGYSPWRTTLMVPRDAAALKVTVPPLSPVEPDAAPASAQRPSTLPGRSAVPVLAWVTAAVTASGVAGGAVFGEMTFSARDAATRDCPESRCTPSGFAEIAQARTDATISTVAFGIGLGSAVATAVFWAVGDPAQRARPHPTSAGVLTLLPIMSFQAKGLAVAGRFE